MFRRALVVLSCLLLAVPATATWSIVAVNPRTGEVAVASATCLTRTNLRDLVAVIAVGKGAASAQSTVDITGQNRMFIFDSFRSTDLRPAQILDELRKSDNQHQLRQYGIASFAGPPATFTGSGAGIGKGGVRGNVDGYLYAVQGNVLVGREVVLGAEEAFRSTKGDMGQRLMAAMEAARVLGGDGRCSCDTANPTDCGVPPADFQKTAHVAFLVVARPGDRDGVCNNTRGCANGDYYLNLNIAGNNGRPSSPDPVFQLQDRYRNWRRGQLGRPDAVLSDVDAVQALPADGRSRRTVTIRLVDVDGNRLTSGGCDVRVRAIGGSSVATPGPVVDHGDGSYSFDLTAGTQPGLDRFRIAAGDGQGTVTLFPHLEIRSDVAAPLHAGFDRISAAVGATVPLAVDVPERPRAYFKILGTLSGTEPGLRFGPFSLPLNPDRFTLTTLVHGGSALLPGTIGKLDDDGRAMGALAAPPELLTSLVGLRVEWAAIVLGKGWPVGTNAVGFDIIP